MTTATVTAMETLQETVLRRVRHDETEAGGHHRPATTSAATPASAGSAPQASTGQAAAATHGQAAETRTITIECMRYNPDTDSAPRYQSYEVPFTHDMSVLDGLQYIKDHLDGSLTYRWSCRMAVCGSCGMMANDMPVLSCQAFLRDYYPDTLRIAPLSHFPIVRDLAVDQSDFLAKLERVKPYIITEEPRTPADGPNLQTPAQMDQYYQFSQCINCMLCYAACPQYGPSTSTRSTPPRTISSAS